MRDCDLQTPLDRQIRLCLANYLAGKSSLREFEEWFVPHALSVVEEHGSQVAEDLTYDIELRLAEFSSGGWTEDELKDLLRPLTKPQTTSNTVCMADSQDTSR